MEINNARRQHILEHLDGPLTMPIYLRVISSAEVKSSAQLLMEPLLEPGVNPTSRSDTVETSTLWRATISYT